jgi:hypothetical protein
MINVKAPVNATPVGAPPSSLDEFKDLYLEQRAQQARLRHVQQFMTSPIFYDLRLPALDTSASAQAIADRRRDVEYRLSVLTSLLGMMQEERKFLDRTLPLAAAPAQMVAQMAAQTGAADA